MSEVITITKERLEEMLAKANLKARMEVVSPFINDMQLSELLGNPSENWLRDWIKSNGLKYTTAGYRKIFRRSQVEKVLNNLIDNPLKKAV